MRRRATDVLGVIAAPGKQNDVLTALQTVLADEDEDIALRCTVADAIGHLKFAQDAKIDADNLVGQLGDLAVTVLAEEVAVAEKDLKKKEPATPGIGRTGRGGRMQGGYGGGYDEGVFGFADETEDAGVFPRRRLAARLPSHTGGGHPLRGQPVLAGSGHRLRVEGEPDGSRRTAGRGAGGNHRLVRPRQ